MLPGRLNKKFSFNGTGGSILLLSLWVFTLFGLLALSLAFRGRLEIKISTIREAKGIVPYSLLSAVNLARARLAADQEQEADSFEDEWYGEGKKDKDKKEKDTKGDKKEKEDVLPWLDDPARKVAYSLFIDDEESRLNINTVPPRVLESFFELLKQQEGKRFLSNPEDLIGGILYWRGDSWLKKEEKKGAYYKKKPFESLEEFFLIPGIKEEDLPLLMSYFTIFPQGKKVPFMMNINTVPGLILKAVIQSIPGHPDAHEKIYEQVLAFREGKLQQQDPGLKEPERGGRLKLGWQGGPGGFGTAGGFQSPLSQSPRAGSGKKQEGTDKKDKRKEEQQKPEPKRYFVESDLNEITLLYFLQLPRTPDLVSAVMQLVPYLTVNSEHFRVRVKRSGEVLKDFGAEVILGSDQEILAWRRI